MYMKLNSIFMDIVVKFNLKKCNKGLRGSYKGEHTSREQKFAIT